MRSEAASEFCSDVLRGRRRRGDERVEGWKAEKYGGTTGETGSDNRKNEGGAQMGGDK